MAIDAPADAARPGGLVRSGLALLAVAVFYTSLDSYAFASSFGPPPVFFVLAFCAFAVMLVMFEPSRPLAVLRSPFGFWVVCYFFLTTLWAPFTTSRPEVVQELYDRYRSMACLLTFAVVFDDPRARRVAVAAVAVAAVFGALVNLAETASFITFPVTEQRVAGRSAGLYFNPNTSGLAIVCGLAVVIEALPRALRVPLLVIAGLGVVATLSRGAMICLAVLLLWLVWRRAIGTGYVVLAGVGALLLTGYAVNYLQSHDLLAESSLLRLQSTDDSGRFALVMKAWGLFASSPWLGNGVGSTIIWDEPLLAHNMYVTFAADHGLLGLLLFPGLGLALVKSNRGAAGLAVVFMAVGFFSHAAVADRYALLLLALAATPAPSPRAAPERGVYLGDPPAAEA